MEVLLKIGELEGVPSAEVVKGIETGVVVI